MGLPSGPDEFKSAYDAGGNEIERQLPGGLITQSVYDHVDRQVALAHSRDGTLLIGQLANYDMQGRVRLGQSVLTAKDFTYDGRDRLVRVEDTYFHGGCTTRKYEFSLDSNRTKLETSAPAGDGSCTTASPVTKTSTFDADSKITNTGYTYDGLGRTRALPAVDTDQPGGSAATMAFHANDMVAKIEQDTQTKTYTLDTAQRISKTTQATSGVALREATNHYANGTDAPAWTDTATRPNASTAWTNTWTRWVGGPDGQLAIEQRSDGTASLQLADMHGDIVSTLPITGAGPGLANYQEFTEYGLPHADIPEIDGTYGPLGAHQRSTDSVGGLTLMGARLYNPTTGRFASMDPVYGGNDNTYIYPVDPVNGQDPTGMFVVTQAYSGARVLVSDARFSKVLYQHNVGYDLLRRIIKYGWYVRHDYRYDHLGYDRDIYNYRVYEYVITTGGWFRKTGKWVLFKIVIDWADGKPNSGKLITAYPILTSSGKPAKRKTKSWTPEWAKNALFVGPVSWY